MRASRWSCHSQDGGAVLIECLGCGSPCPESPPLVLIAGVLSLWRCPLVHITPTFPGPVLTLKGGVYSSHTSSALIVCQPTTCLVSPPYLPLVASVPGGTTTPEGSALEVREPLGADGASLCAVSVRVDGAIPMPGDDARGLFHDWVMSGVGIGAPRSTVPDDAAPTPGHLILRARGYLAIDWRQWRTMQHSRAWRLMRWRGCYMRCWLWSAGTSCV
jgi:hypothetical protein